MKNKWFSRGLWFALVLTLVLGLTLATAPSASAETSGDWTYTVSGGVATVTGYTGSTARISIPESFGSYTVTAVGANAFKGNTTIQSVSFPSTLLSIGDNAFSDCVNLTEVTLPEKLTYLGNYSFSNCTKLSKLTINSVSINNKDDYRDEPFYNAGSATDGMTVTFASGCTRVPSYLFFAYSGPSTAANLKSVTFADSVTSIGTAAFQDCPTLSTVSFGSGLTTIENRAFSGCAGLKTFTLPAAVTSIGNYAFCGTGLTGFTLSDSLTSIGEGAFSECTNLTELTLPKKLTNLGNYSFSNCTKLSSITIHSVSINNKDDYRDEPFYNVGSATDGVTVTFASGCTRVPSYLFFAYSGPSTAANLKSVIFADSVTSIGTAAFQNCPTLDTLSFGSGLTTIENRAFSSCTGLKTFTLPASVTSIGNYAFCGAGLTGFTLSDSLTSIGEGAFSECTNLTELTLPKKLTNLGNYSFSNCTKLSSITIHSVSINNKDDYKDEPFYNVGSATDGVTVTFASGCTRVPSYLFFAYSGPSTAANLKSVTFADSVTSIGTAAFQNCPTLDTLSFGSGLTTIENRAFSGCTGLKTFTLPAAVTSIGNYAFCGAGLTGFTLSDSLTSIGEGAFSECTNLTEVTLPRKLTNLGNYAFSNCTKLSKITINSTSISNKDDYKDEPFYNVGSATDGVTVIFASGCTRVPSNLFFAYSGPSTAANLKEVILANTVTSIGDSAFESCTTLETVTLGKGVTTIEREAFKNCTGMERITILDHVTSIGANAFSGCENTLTIYGYYETAAHAHAVAYNIPFVALDKPVDENPFKDVKEGKFYYDAVLWAVENGITKGVTDDEFWPEQACTRGQVVTFLWNAMGKPEPTSTYNPFKDVSEGRYYYKAVLWAVENKITMGMSPTEFQPNLPCNRGQVVTFLHRAMGTPKPSSSTNPFTDVSSNRYYYNAVLWAVEENITKGMTQQEFWPDYVCTRGHVVTFLYRCLTEN